MLNTLKYQIITILIYLPFNLLQIKEFQIESLEFSPGSEDLLVFDYTLKQVNATNFAISAEYELKEELDDSYSAQLNAYMVTRGDKFFEVYRSKPQGICEMLKTHGAKMPIDLSDACPIEPTKGSLEEQVMNMESMMAMGIAGRFKMEITIFKDNVEKLKATMIVSMK